MSHTTAKTPEAITASQRWFEEVVLGLNLCPFAHRPAKHQQIRFYLSEATSESELMDELIGEFEKLEATPADQIETTLVVTEKLLGDFYDYQFFLEEANRKIKTHHWQGVFQLASFHPDYCFAGAELNEPSNLTNRSPYPIIHILREDSLSKILDLVDKPDEIPEANIEKMEGLSEEDRQRLFPYLYREE